MLGPKERARDGKSDGIKEGASEGKSEGIKEGAREGKSEGTSLAPLTASRIVDGESLGESTCGRGTVIVTGNSPSAMEPVTPPSSVGKTSPLIGCSCKLRS
jgi:hypothetical protein